jgi:hypothetical protein
VFEMELRRVFLDQMLAEERDDFSALLIDELERNVVNPLAYRTRISNIPDIAPSF